MLSGVLYLHVSIGGLAKLVQMKMTSARGAPTQACCKFRAVIITQWAQPPNDVTST